MNTPKISGKYFSIEGNTLNIGPGLCFGFAKNGSWFIWHPSTDLLGIGFPQEFDPSPVKAKIESMIKTDATAGREHLIDHVGLNPLAFVQLWCEGVLNPDMFNTAVETDEYVEVNVELGGKIRKVRVYAEPDYAMATFTAEGEVV